jgi:hypothetical protein
MTPAASLGPFSSDLLIRLGQEQTVPEATLGMKS